MAIIKVKIDHNQLKNAYFNRLIGNITATSIGQESSLCSSVMEKIGVTFDKQYQFIKDKKPSIMQVAIEALMKTVDLSVDKFLIERNDMISIEESKSQFALEAATEELYNLDEGDTLGGTIADMVMDVGNRTSEQIKDLAKYVLRLEKQVQDNKKEELEEENEIISEENKENLDGDSDPFGEGSDDETNTENGDGAGGDFTEGDDNPFGEGTTEPGNTSGSDDPFGTPGNNEPNADQETSGDNPFEGSTGDTGTEQQENDKKKEDDSNPFGTETQEPEDKTTTENPFESLTNISDFSFNNGMKPFTGLESGDLTRFILANTSLLFKDKMKETVEQFGTESVQYNQIRANFQKTNKIVMEASVGCLSMAALLGFRINPNVIKYPEIFDL